MAHSLPYFVAAGIVAREVTWEHATPAKILDPVIGRVQDKVIIDPVAEHHAMVSRWCGGTVTITTTSGQTFSSTVMAPRGSGRAGVDWADVDAKFRALAPARLRAGQIGRCLEFIHNATADQSIADLVKELRPG
jgi:2-methylcitrate dehydratase PrpD